MKNIEPDSVLWFAYPKGTSTIKTDINRDAIRIKGEEFGITTVTAISINNTWSALRFRPIDKVGIKMLRSSIKLSTNHFLPLFFTKFIG